MIKDKKLKLSFINKRFNSDSIFLVVLKKFYGLNHFLILKLFQKFGIPENIRFRDVKKSMILRLEFFIQNYLNVERKLKYLYTDDMKLLSKIKTYNSLRLFKGLPVHGQRTRSNAQTAKKLNRKMYKF